MTLFEVTWPATTWASDVVEISCRKHSIPITNNQKYLIVYRAYKSVKGRKTNLAILGKLKIELRKFVKGGAVAYTRTTPAA